jgi:hypothetical protein
MVFPVRLKMTEAKNGRREIGNGRFRREGALDRQVPRKPRLVGGVKGHNQDDISFPGSPGLWPGSFTFFKTPSPIFYFKKRDS